MSFQNRRIDGLVATNCFAEIFEVCSVKLFKRTHRVGGIVRRIILCFKYRFAGIVQHFVTIRTRVHNCSIVAVEDDASATAFRQWALNNREEFSLVFTNLDVSCIEELQAESKTGLLFSELLFEVWARYKFPVPRLKDLDPELVKILRDPKVPADLTGVPDEMRPLIWLLQRAWAGLYGTVTLEVFGHIDPRIVEHALLFRAMMDDQAVPLGLSDELPRLRKLISSILAA